MLFDSIGSDVEWPIAYIVRGKFSRFALNSDPHAGSPGNGFSIAAQKSGPKLARASMPPPP